MRTTPRLDCPLHLPDAHMPVVVPTASASASRAEALLPLNDLQRTILEVHSRLSGVEVLHASMTKGDHSEVVRTHFEMIKSQSVVLKGLSASYKVCVQPSNMHLRGSDYQ